MKNKHIIKSNNEFQNIIQEKKFCKNSAFVIYYVKNDLSYLRFGISAGKKIGNAVLRNRIKRQVRHIFYELRNEIYNKSLSLICIVKFQFLNQSFEENKTSLLNLVKKIY